MKDRIVRCSKVYIQALGSAVRQLGGGNEQKEADREHLRTIGRMSLGLREGRSTTTLHLMCSF